MPGQSSAQQGGLSHWTATHRYLDFAYPPPDSTECRIQTTMTDVPAEHGPPRGHLGQARQEPGQGLVEYALVILLIAIGCVGAVTGFGIGVRDYYQYIVDNLPF